MLTVLLSPCFSLHLLNYRQGNLIGNYDASSGGGGGGGMPPLPSDRLPGGEARGALGRRAAEDPIQEPEFLSSGWLASAADVRAYGGLLQGLRQLPGHVRLAGRWYKTQEGGAPCCNT